LSSASNLGPRERPRAGSDDAEIAGDPDGRAGMVAGDHQHPHACGVRLRHGVGPRRVDDADQPELDQLALDGPSAVVPVGSGR
jgi:hypothetical protein